MSGLRRGGQMTVGELPRRTGVPIKTLRQYTDTGLVYSPGAALPAEFLS